MNEPLKLEIRALQQAEEMRTILDLQRDIWGYGETGAEWPYPMRGLLAAVHTGGLVSCAFVQNLPVGFTFCWIGRQASTGRIYLHSQLVGVRAEYRGHGVGKSLKLHQLEFAKRSGIDLIRWTFDPLRLGNAHFNIRTLGVLCDHYAANLYGRMDSYFDLGVESDRLWANWYVDSSRVRNRLSGETLEDIAAGVSVLQVGPDNLPQWSQLDEMASHLRIEVPSRIDHLRRGTPHRAAEWQQALRQTMKTYLDGEYTVTDFWIASHGSQKKGVYLLSQISPESIGLDDLPAW